MNQDTIPPALYAFILKDGRVVTATGDKGEANGWVKHMKPGETVAKYELKDSKTKERGR